MPMAAGRVGGGSARSDRNRRAVAPTLLSCHQPPTAPASRSPAAQYSSSIRPRVSSRHTPMNCRVRQQRVRLGGREWLQAHVLAHTSTAPCKLQRPRLHDVGVLQAAQHASLLQGTQGEVRRHTRATGGIGCTQPAACRTLRHPPPNTFCLPAQTWFALALHPLPTPAPWPRPACCPAAGTCKQHQTCGGSGNRTEGRPQARSVQQRQQQQRQPQQQQSHSPALPQHHRLPVGALHKRDGVLRHQRLPQARRLQLHLGRQLLLMALIMGPCRHAVLTPLHLH